MRTARLVILPLILAAAADATVDPCGPLGKAQDFAIVARDAVKIKAFPVRDYSDTSYFAPTIGNICAGKGQIQDLWLDGDFVATATKGSAIAAKRLPYSYAEGNLVNFGITGGGAFSGAQYASLYGIDATGLNPMVGVCEQAKSDMGVASSLYSSMTPTHEIGNIVVRAGETYTLDLRGAGDAVVTVNSLIMYGQTGPDRLPYCSESLGEPNEAWLDIQLDPGQHFVMNIVSSLSIGHCAGINFPYRTEAWGVFNVVGPGPKVNIGKGEHFGIVLLGPERRVSVMGLSGFGATRWSGIYAKSVQISGDMWHYGECGLSQADCGDDRLSPGFLEWCDGADAPSCPGACLPDCFCSHPANETCGTATPVASFPFHERFVGGFTNAYYTFTAPADGTLLVTDRGGGVGGMFAKLYEPTCTTTLQTGYDHCPRQYEDHRFTLTGGQTYVLGVDTSRRTAVLDVTLTFTPS